MRLAESQQKDLSNRTEGVSAAFIKELMRPIAQFNIERNGHGQVSDRDIDGAPDELLANGGLLNLKIPGGQNANYQVA